VDWTVSSAWIDGDETRVEQILDNLVGNAIKYTPAGGRIMVRVAVDAGQALLEVADTGVGIPPSLIGTVFDLFAQGGQAPDRAGGGLGTGLPLVKALVELHGGTVVVASNGIEGGSVFTVHLPRGAGPADTAAPGVSATPRAAKRRILVVEDDVDT